jgi:hypothetical protein
MKSIYKLLLVFTVLTVGFFSCQKDTLVTDVPHNVDPDFTWGKGDSIPIVAPYYFTGKVDSVFYTLQDSINGFYNLVFDSGYVACDSPSVFYGQLTGMYSLSGTHTLEIKLLKCIGDSTSKPDKESLLYIGTYPYGNSNILSYIDGVEVSWVDDTGKIWKSLTGSGSKANDSFQILSVTAAPTNVLGESVILGKMDMTLYNGTESIRIEGGEFQFQYGVY